MAKEKDFSTKLVDLAQMQNFKVLIGDLGEEIAAMASQGDRFFDTYGAGRIMLVNSQLTLEERRVAMAQALKTFVDNYANAQEDFYFDVKTKDLNPEAVLEILINGKDFSKRYKALSKKNSYNDTIVALSKEFMVRPSLVAKYARTR